MLKENEILDWIYELPEDVKDVIDDGNRHDPQKSELLVEKILQEKNIYEDTSALDKSEQISTTLEKIVNFIHGDHEGAEALGRSGRMRLLAWMADEVNTVRPQKNEAIKHLLGELSEHNKLAFLDKEVTYDNKIVEMFREDVTTFMNKVVGPRAIGKIVKDGVPQLISDSIKSIRGSYIRSLGKSGAA